MGTAHVCKDEDEWNSMTTADFAQYKAVIIPDCLCNTSLKTIQFLDDTKRVWSPAVTGNMVLIGTDPSFHAKWYNLAGAFAMMQDGIRHVAASKKGTGMYMSLSCYYQSNAKPTTIDALSEIGNFQVRGNLSHPCLNNAHMVATSSVMTSLNDQVASNWNCSVHEVFTEYPRTGSEPFEALAIALNATGDGQQSFADGTSGIPYIIARGATPIGCGNNITEPTYKEECDDGAANGTPESLLRPIPVPWCRVQFDSQFIRGKRWQKFRNAGSHHRNRSASESIPTSSRVSPTRDGPAPPGTVTVQPPIPTPPKLTFTAEPPMPSGSAPGTVTVLPHSVDGPSESRPVASPGTVVVTASAQPSGQEPPVTVTANPSGLPGTDSSPDPSVTTVAGEPIGQSSSMSHAQPVDPIVTVTPHVSNEPITASTSQDGSGSGSVRPPSLSELAAKPHHFVIRGIAV
ncbi:hypothetical protein OQA88_8492 [Cercophora sp. LCS_1]